MLSLLAAAVLQAAPLDDPLPTAGTDPSTTASAADDWGHSQHGAAYDVGPRQRPWKMEGIGSVHLPITTRDGTPANHEVQAWFDQGLAHLHGFWWYEAERAFRWCLTLDPDCAMAHWGLAQAALGNRDAERSAEFVARARACVAPMAAVELGFIEVHEGLLALRGAERKGESDAVREAEDAVGLRLEQLMLEHPDHVEVLALHFQVFGSTTDDTGDRYGREAVLRRILELDPDHIGALHYRVHNWDGEEGRYAIDSCQALTRVAPNSGHLQHMPGHVLSGIGMWHEAALAMDSATRVEMRYMEERAVLPENNWDYLHNLDYLCYIQSQLGMHDAAVLGAQQLLLAPAPTNLPAEFAAMADFIRVGPMLRSLLAAERWQDVLDGDLLEWSEPAPPPVRMMQSMSRAYAHLGLGDVEAAEAELAGVDAALAALPAEMRRPGGDPARELRGLLAVARGDALEGVRLLTEAADEGEENWSNDPPRVPRYGFNVLGDAMLELGSHQLAAEAYERTLETVFHDGTALAGLVQCYDALGEDQLASAAMSALEVVWCDADPGDRRLEAARGTGVVAAAPGTELPERFAQAMVQRPYRATVYHPLGPSLYRSAPAPELVALDATGAPVTLAEQAGANVLLVFYLGDQCLHCVEQLQAIQARLDEFTAAETRVLAVSKDSVERIAGYQDGYGLTLLSDPEFANARRFASYDDFEGIELHSTLLIDRDGRVHWSRIGGDPFMDVDFLVREAERLGADGLVTELRVAGR